MTDTLNIFSQHHIIMQKKDNIVSYFKGLAIILVVLGHAGLSSEGIRFIYAFHMALFYFASGMLFKNKYLQEPDTFLKRKVSGLYIPFVKYSVLFLLIHNLLVVVNCHSGMYEWNDFKNGIVKILLFVNVDQMQSHMWFMRSLFVSYIIFYFTLLFFKQFSYRVKVLSFLIMMLGGLAIAQQSINLPIRLERELVCASLIAFGYYFPRTVIEAKGYKKLICVALICFAALMFMVQVSSDKIVVAESEFVHPLYFIISSVMGIMLIYCIAVILDKNWGGHFLLLKYIGNNTLTIYVFHILAFRIVNYLKVIHYEWDLSRIAEIEIIYDNNNLLWSIIYTIIGISIPLLFHQIYYCLKTKISND